MFKGNLLFPGGGSACVARPSREWHGTQEPTHMRGIALAGGGDGRADRESGETRWPAALGYSTDGRAVGEELPVECPPKRGGICDKDMPFVNTYNAYLCVHLILDLYSGRLHLLSTNSAFHVGCGGDFLETCDHVSKYLLQGHTQVNYV